MPVARARAFSNIAFIKYWGNADDALRLPLNNTISMNLDGLYTETEVRWSNALQQDELILNGHVAEEAARHRVSRHLDYLRHRFSLKDHASVVSSNNFPMGAGIASSASAFAALTAAAVAAANQQISEAEMSTLARLGSGSASRSVPGGFVEWYAGTSHETSYAETIAPANHWNLVDLITIIRDEHKSTGSQEGHTLAATSELQKARIVAGNQRAQRCREALLHREFLEFAEVVEHDSNLMHAVMMTSQPPLFYWAPATLTVMSSVRAWREQGHQVCYTIDAGPNVHCICIENEVPWLESQLRAIPGVKDVLKASPGGPAQVISTQP